MQVSKSEETKTTLNPIKKIQFTSQSRRAHVTAFENSQQTMTGYCLQNGLLLSTFSSWVAKYGSNKKRGFIPITVQAHSAVKEIKKPMQRIEIHRGDVKVILPEINDFEAVVNLIKVVMQCN